MVAFGLLLLQLYGAEATPLSAQSVPSTTQSVDVPGMTEQQLRGEGLFFQRCSICHQVRKIKNLDSPPTVGPDLAGVFAKATADEASRLREFILKGSARMPGFQYGLETKHMDDLIAYLKIKTE